MLPNKNYYPEMRKRDLDLERRGSKRGRRLKSQQLGELVN
jgi:hypothetical protein